MNVIFIDGVRFTVDQLITLYKHRFRSAEAFVNQFKRFLDTRPGLEEIVVENWETIQPLSIQELFAPAKPYSDNAKRLYFQTVGPKAIFDELKGKKMISHKEFESEHPKTGKFTNVYELYTIEDNRLPNGRAAVLTCFCPSTGADHYLYVNPTGTHIDKKDALLALASICYSPVDPSAIKQINRQGEVYYFTFAKGAKLLQAAVPVPAEIYFKKLKYES